MRKIKDIMTKNVISVEKDTPIFDAIEMLAKNNITGLPVVNEDMTMAGVLTEKDVLRLFMAPEEGEGKAVNDFMTQPAISFDENESLIDVCECLTNNFFRRVPVTSKGKLVGVVSRRDIIFEYILELHEAKRTESLMIE